MSLLGRTNLRLFIEMMKLFVGIFKAMATMTVVNNMTDDNHAEMYTAEFSRTTSPGGLGSRGRWWTGP